MKITRTGLVFLALIPTIVGVTGACLLFDYMHPIQDRTQFDQDADGFIKAAKAIQ